MKYIKNLSEINNTNFKEFDNNFGLQDLLVRKSIDYDKCIEIVKKIEKSVIDKWDLALKELTLKFDWVEINNFLVDLKDLQNAKNKVSDKFKKSVKIAYENINKFHKRQLRKNLERKQTNEWVYCWQEFRAIENVWLYIPWWTAPLFSTVLMLGIPAIIAWSNNIVLTTPPNKNWEIAPEILYVANLLWIKKVFKIWWAQAIFAIWYGTEQVSKVDKIFWPWNSFVTAAKMIMSQKVAIDMPAWPSEVLVIADKYSNPSFVAADLLSQAEHGPDSQVVLVSDNKNIIESTLIELEKQRKKLDRDDVIWKSLENSFVILTSDLNKAIEVSNSYAPEHLILQIKDVDLYLNKIINAWSVFCWAYTPESAGDYISWTNHTLPTSWFAKSFSWVWVESFWKRITFQKITEKWIKNIWENIEIMANAEWLQAHKNAVSVRINN